MAAETAVRRAPARWWTPHRLVEGARAAARLVTTCVVLSHAPAAAETQTDNTRPDSPALREAWRSGKAEIDYGQGAVGVLFPGDVTRWSDRGINIFGWYMNSFQFNTGGLAQGTAYAGLFDFGVDFDLQRLIARKGLYLHVSGSWSSGINLTDDVGAFIPVNAVYCEVSLRFFELWLEQLWRHDTLSLRLGRLTIGWEYGLDYDNFTKYLSAAFRLNVFGLDANTPNFSVIPFANWGARLRWTPNERWRFQGSFMNGYPHDFAADDKHGLEWEFRPGEGAFFIAEGTYQWGATRAERSARPGLLPGRLFVGAFWDTGEFDDLDGSGATKKGMGSVYVIVKQKFWEPQRMSSRGANLWTALVFSTPEQTAEFPYYWNGGLSWVGPHRSRPEDRITVGFADGWFSSAVEGASHETTLEVTYSYEWRTWLEILPDFQYIIRPGGTGDIDNAFVIGALFYVTF